MAGPAAAGEIISHFRVISQLCNRDLKLKKEAPPAKVGACCSAVDSAGLARIERFS